MNPPSDDTKTKGQLVAEIEALRSRFSHLQKPISTLPFTRDICLQRLFRLGMTGIVVSHENGTIVEANDAYLELVGYSREELRSGKLNWIELTPPEYAPCDQEANQQLRVFGICPPYEKEYIRKDQSRVPILIGCAHMETFPGYAVAFVLDLTAQKQAELALRQSNELLELRVSERAIELMRTNEQLQRELYERVQAQQALRDSENRYRSLVESSPNAIAVHDYERFLYVNPAFVKLIRAPHADALIGQCVVGLVHPDSHEQVRHCMEQMQQGTPLLKDIPSRLICWDGTEIDVEVTAASIVFEQKQAVQVILRDVTARNQVERMKTEFISIASHELRTPLTTLQGALSLLVDGAIDPGSTQGKRTLEMALQGVDDLARIVNDILDLEQLQVDRLKLTKQLCEVTTLLHQAIASVKPIANCAEVSFAVSAASIQVQVNRDFMIQVLTHLLTNAIKFSPKGSTVRLQVQTVELISISHVLISVIDQGQGIPSDKLETIFDRFQQVDASDSRPVNGAGLGLAICRRIVQQHDGQIWAESSLGQGSQFHIALPVQVGIDYDKANSGH